MSNSLLVVPSPMEFLTSSVLVFISDRQGSLATAVHLRIILSSPHVCAKIDRLLRSLVEDRRTDVWPTNGMSVENL